MAKKKSSGQDIAIQASFTEVFSIIEHNRARAFAGGYITLMLPFAPVMTADRDTVKNLHFHEFAAYTDGVV